MENNNDLFDLSLDSAARLHLQETARWARVVAIVGLCMLGLMIIFFVVMLAIPFTAEATPFIGVAEVAGGMISMLCMALLYFFPCYFTLLFANRMRDALKTNDARLLGEAFRNLKRVFRFVGVLTLIFVGFFALGLVSSLFI